MCYLPSRYINVHVLWVQPLLATQAGKRKGLHPQNMSIDHP
ncbi:hypothetical protein AB205_0090270 [Aquarana catesbeiana]|uniref:Uncharacterized protein n=1 Tax=Aquarana catesbeiana TaxID=8400 RepID=A0A2G9RW85_AQUCT|nr:hypothetical protein AB205_0090270 [Aquarana catesbeiana]